MSGMAHVVVVSKRVQVELDTGVSVSIHGDPGDYFDREERGLLNEAATLLPVIDAWAEQADDQLMVLSPSSRLTELSCGPYAEPSLHRLSVSVAIQSGAKPLQGSLCKWLADHASGSTRAKVVRVDGERRKVAWGEFYQRGAYVRADLADEWRRLQTLDLERWIPVIERAVKAVETKLSIKLHPRDESGRRMGIVTANNGVSVFDALFEHRTDELDLAIVNAFYYEHAIAERDAGYDTKLPDGTKDYLATRPATGDERERAAKTIGELGKRLKAAYAPHGVSMALGEQRGWDENRRLLAHLSLFERLIKDAGNIGPQMKKNKVTRVRFAGLPWDDDKEKKSVNMRVHTAKLRDDEEFNFDIAPITLSTKEKEFMQFLVGRPPD